ncbi:hypothetical protein POSPLADRAFT_1141735 [Postia placenta MAD-698-R-SB12]|uniref:FAD/NAD(P)-binding domain-containing protein n=1 Tax=Postia placenta MAD-698-R-SB12 TaxID=670580 RepID=A0A1X6N2V0_9APHY|nr:hypothetical protein POSPLADRAFT_1141735 [Postia placenta MAD-698-R-SB12]OSX62773.1 hypothetical protein POSPLADRAFT_1141735 [Postia placenta MAD-698-R-SB12]
MSSLAAERENYAAFFRDTVDALRHGDMLTLLSPTRMFRLFFNTVYILSQLVIIWLFKPPPPPRHKKIAYRGRIAVIGAGLTGVSTAAHAVAHGFDVVLYEQGDRIGGIWAHVNASSGLQLNSLLYRFHPAVLWSRAFPKRDEILSEITRVWREYDLERHTRLSTPVTSVRRAKPQELDDVGEGHGLWVINDDVEGGGVFDTVVVTVGTCGKPRWIGNSSGTSQEETFAGLVLHSSEMDDAPLEGKRVIVIGSGASGVEAVEAAIKRGAKTTDGGVVMIARNDKWIIPRNIVMDTLISAQPFGREMPLRWVIVWEKIITAWNYHGVEDLTPARLGLFEGTPVVNDEFLGHVRRGRCSYVRGDPQQLTSGGVRVNVRRRASKPGDEGEEKEFSADVIVLATGFQKPEIGFLPDDLFPEGYERPNLYLQNFSTEDWSVLMTNSSYTNAIDIARITGLFKLDTRMLLTFLMDKNARPIPKDMKLWVDVLRFVKRGARGGALGFFTYMELTIWLLLFHVFRLDRLKWLFFIMQGWGVRPKVVGDADAEADNKPLGARERNEVEGDSGKKASPITPGGNVNGWVRGD